MICLIITFISGIAVIGSILYSQRSLELDKQRLAAMNYCRQAFEQATTFQTVTVGSRVIESFNNNASDLVGNLTEEFYSLNDDGSVNWDDPRTEASLQKPTYLRVTINWMPQGTIERPQTFTMEGLVTKDLL
jgi:hypothetical protein